MPLIQYCGSDPGFVEDNTGVVPDVYQPGQTCDPLVSPVPPTWFCQTDTTFTIGDFVQLTSTVTGEPGRMVTITVVQQPAGSVAYIDPPGNFTYATISWSTTGFAAGVYPVELLATDDLGSTATCEFNITLEEPTVPPEDPTGACCINGVSSIETLAACTAAGGRYFGDFSSIVAGMCDNPPAPMGACCVDGSCDIMTEEACALASGTYFGDYTICTPTICDETPEQHACGDCPCQPDPVVDANVYPAPNVVPTPSAGTGIPHSTVSLSGPVIPNPNRPVNSLPGTAPPSQTDATRVRASVTMPEE